jgi:hypothetical protein
MTLEDRRLDFLRGLPEDVIREIILVGCGHGLRVAGCFLKREGGSHSLWLNPKNGVIKAVPRHNEIKEPLAKEILKRLDAE